MGQETEPKSLSMEALMQRFLERGHLSLTPFDPGRDLLYIHEEQTLYLYTPQKFYRPLSGTDLFEWQLAKFLRYEQSPLGADPDRELPVKPLHPLMPVDRSFIARMEAYLPLVLPADKILNERPYSSLIVFSDGFARDLSLPDAPKIAANRTTKAFSYVNFPSTLLEAKFDATKECPRFAQFLREVLVTEDSAQEDNPQWDPHLTLFMQEIFGFCLLSGVKAQHAFFFTGTGQNGKSITLKLIQKLFPQELVSALRISDFTGSAFRAAGLVGKQANIVHEEQSEKMDVAVLKNLISGEPMQVERKFKDPVLFVPRVKFFWGTNQIPSFEEIDPALKRRISIVPFFRTIPDDKRDLDLMDKLEAELPGIFHFALEGAKVLLANNFRFHVPDAVKKSMENFEVERYPALSFFHECYEITGKEEDSVLSQDLYNDYVAWCERNGHRNKLSMSRFMKQIANIDKKRIRLARLRADGSQPLRARTGIKRRQVTPPTPSTDNKNFQF